MILLEEELDLSLLLLEDSPDFTELLLVLFSLLEEDLPVSASSDDSTSFSAEDSIFLAELLDSSSQSLQIEDEESTAAFSSGPLLEADEESSQAERAKNAASTATHKKPRPLTHFIPLSPVKIFTTHKPSNVKYGMWNLYRKIHHQTRFKCLNFEVTCIHFFLLLFFRHIYSLLMKFFLLLTIN